MNSEFMKRDSKWDSRCVSYAKTKPHPLVWYFSSVAANAEERLEFELTRLADCVNAFFDQELFEVLVLSKSRSAVVCRCGWVLNVNKRLRTPMPGTGVRALRQMLVHCQLNHTSKEDGPELGL